MASKKAAGVGVWDSLRRFDAHPKAMEDFRVHTAHGGFVSLAAIVVMVLLALLELRYALQTEVVDRLYVNSLRKQKLTISFNIVFPKVHCDLMGVDVNDQIGNPQDGVAQRVFKTRLSANGERVHEGKHQLGATMEHETEIVNDGEEARRAEEVHDPNCGDCFGAGEPQQCCQTCDDVRAAYRTRGWTFHPETVTQCESEDFRTLQHAQSSSEGCRVYGEVDVTSVAGNFHFAPAEHLKKMHRTQADALRFAFQQFNVSHHIDKLSFGHSFPGSRDPLEGHEKFISDGYGMYQYYIKVVPTTFKYLSPSKPVLESNQYSVNEHLRHVTPGAGRGLPGVYFFYDISPIHAVFEERRKRGWSQFLVSLCAILGGVFTLMGLLDQGIHTATKSKR